MLQQILSQIYPLDKYNIIVANGQFPSHPFLLGLIKNAKMLICCDGAIHKLSSHHITPDYIVGDCDSLQTLEDGILNDRIIKLTDQNTNDLTKAVDFACMQLKLDNLIILGATGLREDHTIANIALLAEYINKVNEVSIISEYGIFTIHSKSTKLSTINGQQVSFFTLDHESSISCKELKWQLKNHKFCKWYQGTLNEAIANSINVEIIGTVIVYRTFEIKNI